MSTQWRELSRALVQEATGLNGIFNFARKEPDFEPGQKAFLHARWRIRLADGLPGIPCALALRPALISKPVFRS